MKPEEFRQRLNELRESLNDPAKATTLLTEIAEEGMTLYGSVATETETRQKLEAENKKLLEANMNLFMKVGYPAQPDTKTVDGSNEDKKRSFDDLFNEKGGLK